MRRHLNTIYVTSEGAWLRKDGENIVVEVDGEERGRAPLHMIGGIVSFARPGASPALMAACAEAGIGLSFLNPNGRFQARVEGRRSGNVLLRRAQYRASDDPVRRVLIARAIVAGKIANQRTVTMRSLRDHGAQLDAAANDQLVQLERQLHFASRRALHCDDVDVVRGIEGDAARGYFAAFGVFIRNKDPAFAFNGRSRRPPMDLPNALLSFFYAILGHDCRSALETVGLDPQVGFLHTDRPGRSSLALDIMEDLRPVLADRLALSLINRRQLSSRDFRKEDGGAVTLTDDGRKAALVAWQERKKEELLHPFLNERVTLGLVPHVQAQLLARHLRGDLDGYPPFIWK